VTEMLTDTDLNHLLLQKVQHKGGGEISIWGGGGGGPGGKTNSKFLHGFLKGCM